MIQFARAVNMEVTLASYEILKDLSVRPLGVGAIGSHKMPQRSPHHSAVVSILADSVSSKSRYSLPTVTALTLTSGSEAVND